MMKTVLIFLAAISGKWSDIVTPNAQETKCLATIIYHEARGEPVMGQAAVAYVAINRKKSRRYPSNLCDVAYQPYQFTNIKHARPNYNNKAWERAVEIAVYAQIGFITDETHGATMYHNPVKAPSPRWDFTKLAHVGDLKNHRFYKEK